MAGFDRLNNMDDDHHLPSSFLTDWMSARRVRSRFRLLVNRCDDPSAEVNAAALQSWRFARASSVRRSPCSADDVPMREARGRKRHEACMLPGRLPQGPCAKNAPRPSHWWPRPVGQQDARQRTCRRAASAGLFEEWIGTLRLQRAAVNDAAGPGQVIVTLPNHADDTGYCFSSDAGS